MRGSLVVGLLLAALAAMTASAGASELRRVTLITGDTVEVATGQGRPALSSVRPGPGREHVQFETRWVDDHLSVIPSDAARALAEGRVDRRLFDITQLLSWDYDDAQVDHVPVLAERAAGQRHVAALAGATVTRSLGMVGMDAISVAKTDVAAFWRDVTGASQLQAGVTKLWLDGRNELQLDQSVPQIGAPLAWQAGFTGRGVTVAVLDSGYDPQHPDLRDVVAEARGFTERGPDDVRDVFGHGTHVASILAGSGAASGGRFRGVAPDARLVVGKVGDFDAPDSATLAAMEWAATEAEARVVSISFGFTDSQGLDPKERAVNRLSAETDALFVIGAGNSGFGGPRTVLSPGSADAALAVGAVDKQNDLWPDSGRGPRIGDEAVKPDITAPGVAITAAVPPDIFGQPYGVSNGTSMATPHVAGAAAILAQRHPDWGNARLKSGLINSAHPRHGLSPFEQGAGRVDVARAVTQAVTASPGNLSTYVRWPRRRPVTRRVNFENDASVAVTLSLDVGAAPERLFRLDARRVTVPANGSASVVVTVDPRRVRSGTYSGVFTAAAGSTRLRTVLGAYVEPRVRDLVVKVLDRRGQPVETDLLVHSQDSPISLPVQAENGTVRARLAPGAYNVAGVVDTPGTDARTVVNVPVSLTRDRRMTIDTREAVPAETTVDEPAAEIAIRQVGVAYRRDGASYGFDAFGTGPRAAAATYALPVRQHGLTFVNQSTWFERGTVDDVGTGHASAFRYELVDLRTGGIPDDPGHHPRTEDLAGVRMVHRAQSAPGLGRQVVGAVFSDDFLTSLTFHESPLPHAMTEYFTPGVQWQRSDDVGTAENPFGQFTERTPREYPAGSSNELFGAAVIGPALPATCFTGTCAARDGDTISYGGDRALYSDAPGDGGLDGEGTVTLARDGKVIQERPLVQGIEAGVPNDPATYTLTASATRDVPYSTLSTRIDAEYTFHSEHTSSRTGLPLMAVRYAPRGLDDHNRAPAGSTTEIPVSMQRNPGAPDTGIESIEIEVSTDDGATWRPVELDEGTIRVENPASGFVSLRAKVTDTAGNTAKQTIIRAYAITQPDSG